MSYEHNARHLTLELGWLRRVVEARYRLHHNEPGSVAEVSEIPVPALNGHSSPYRQVIEHFGLSPEERLILILALVPHIQPNALDDLLANVDPRLRAELPGDPASGLLPTVETALFLLAGDDLEQRLFYLGCFAPEALLTQARMLTLNHTPDNSSLLAARLDIDREFLGLFTSGIPPQPQFGHAFPAKRLTSPFEWSHLVLPAKTRAQIDEVRAWIDHGGTLLYDWGLIQKFAPGYRCLFHGPSGTGKTMTAALLGKASDLEVFRVDLSMVVSKYIGETEKNLGKVFDQAENQRWILFFDEADALFGKRTNVQDAHDRYANQEVAYLLQRVEDYTGVVILATNMKQNLDEAFARRFQNLVHFPMPGKLERLRIWRNGFSSRSTLEDEVDLESIAAKYELSGGGIMNVIRYASLMALDGGGSLIRHRDIRRGIQREYAKEGRTLR